MIRQAVFISELCELFILLYLFMKMATYIQSDRRPRGGTDMPLPLLLILAKLIYSLFLSGPRQSLCQHKTWPMLMP